MIMEKNVRERGRFAMLFGHYFSLVLIFIFQKPLFMLYTGALQHRYGLKDWVLVMWHGFSIDLSVAGYLTVFPLLVVTIGLWIQSLPVKRIIQVYDALVSLLLSAIFVGDAALYPFWGFKLDASVLFYLKTPKEAVASVSPFMAVVGVVAILAFAYLFYRILIRPLKPVSVPYRKVLMPLVVNLLCFILAGLLFLAIRGGLTASTMNVGHAYFTTDQFLNHSAVNPGFSLLSSVSKTSDYSQWCDYFDEERRSRLFDGLYSTDDTDTDTLLNTTRPNVLLVVLEGFGGDFVNAISGRGDVSPRMDSLIKEGVFFSNCYASSFRTDRGLVCVVNGHPGLPMTSIMKLPVKSSRLPSIPAKLAENGYSTYFMYGGDINFTNMQSWLYSSGFSHIVSESDFTAQERKTHAWGVNDDITFSRLYEDLRDRKDSLWITGFLSLSSHEPFEVPYHRLDDKICNAFAYTDSCLGALVDSLRSLPLWDNLLMVITPDHGFRYPQEGFAFDPHVHHIPILWVGGAVREPRVIDKFTSQTDLAATLLAQLGIDHSDFLFSRNVMSGSYTYPFSFYTFSNGLCFIDSTGVTLYDDDSGKCLIEDPDTDGLRLDRGKAILQTLYDDLEAR